MKTTYQRKHWTLGVLNVARSAYEKLEPLWDEEWWLDYKVEDEYESSPLDCIRFLSTVDRCDVGRATNVLALSSFTKEPRLVYDVILNALKKTELYESLIDRTASLDEDGLDCALTLVRQLSTATTVQDKTSKRTVNLETPGKRTAFFSDEVKKLLLSKVQWVVNWWKAAENQDSLELGVVVHCRNKSGAKILGNVDFITHDTVFDLKFSDELFGGISFIQLLMYFVIGKFYMKLDSFKNIHNVGIMNSKYTSIVKVDTRNFKRSYVEQILKEYDLEMTDEMKEYWPE